MAHRDRAQSRICWSDIVENVSNLEKLHLLCSHEKALRGEGYVIAPLSEVTLLSKLRCQNCGSKMRPSQSIARNPNNTGTDDTSLSIRGQHHTKIHSKRDFCEFHPGRVINMHFTCCQAHVSIQKGCQINLSHLAPANHKEVLKNNWTYHTTPPSPVWPQPVSAPPDNHRGRARFTNLTATSARKAVALDCEFGVSTLNEPEVIRMTAVDLFTKQVLVDSLVKPNVVIKSYQTRWSGVTGTDMRNAVQNNDCIFGRDAARNRLLDFIDQDTVIVVHGGSSDMSSLRLIHPRILDTHLLETYLEALPGGRSLKNLCEKKLGIRIQSGRGHDSLEDALACRELAVWLMNSIPDV